MYCEYVCVCMHCFSWWTNILACVKRGVPTANYPWGHPKTLKWLLPNARRGGIDRENPRCSWQWIKNLFFIKELRIFLLSHHFCLTAIPFVRPYITRPTTHPPIYWIAPTMHVGQFESIKRSTKKPGWICKKTIQARSFTFTSLLLGMHLSISQSVHVPPGNVYFPHTLGKQLVGWLVGWPTHAHQSVFGLLNPFW